MEEEEGPLRGDRGCLAVAVVGMHNLGEESGQSKEVVVSRRVKNKEEEGEDEEEVETIVVQEGVEGGRME